jgi:hypothetical protein
MGERVTRVIANGGAGFLLAEGSPIMHDDGSEFGDGGFFKAFMWFCLGFAICAFILLRG